jgi:phage baseplate assembly protein gpV
MFVPQSLRTRSDPMSNQPEQARPGVPDEGEVVAEKPVDSDTATDPTQVGEQVMAVLASAQQAADQMLTSAREEAERVRSDAQEQAAASRTEALSETARVQRESARIRLEVETYGKETRDAADVHAAETRAEAEHAAERRLAEAEERAQAIVAGAEQQARDVAQQEVRRQEGAVRRQEALAAGVKQYEERLENLLEVFRGMATQLEDLIRTNQEAKDQEEEHDAEAPADEALEEVLRPERQAHTRPS